MTNHPDPELLAAFAEGRVDAKARAAIVEHLDGCEECMSDVALAMAARGDEGESRQRTSWRPWLPAMAAALTLAVVGLALFRDAIPFGRSPIRRLVALAPDSERLIEPRLSGGFAWAEYAGAHRGSEDATTAAQLKLAGAAGELVERADREHAPETEHAAGVAMLLVQKPTNAITRLESAAAASHDATIWSDLAAARYAAASEFGRASLYPQALAAADAALRIDPNFPEALFNRALILERLGLAGEAKKAWEKYLSVDPSSPWAAEARQRLGELPASTTSSDFDRNRPLLQEAAEHGDMRAVAAFVGIYRDRARAFAEAEYLGRWGEAVQREDDADAARWLTISRNIADALAKISGDSLVLEGVQTIDRASAADRGKLAEAHVVYRSGRIAYSRHRLDDADRDLRRAAEIFDAAHDPMALAARYYAAGVLLSRNETAAARAELESVRAAVDAHATFTNLGAHVRWELGRAHMLEDDWSAAVPVLTEGAAMFHQSGERASQAFVEAMLARALAFMGRDDDAWLARLRAFAALSAEGEPSLLSTAVDAAMHAELLAGRTDAAQALSALALDVARGGTEPQLVKYALTNEAMLLATTGRPADALRAAQQAEAMARATADPTLRARELADVATATGAALAETDPRAAGAPLTRAIDYYRQHELPLSLPEPLLLRARCAMRAGDTSAAMRDLDEGIAIVERRRAGTAETASSASVLEPEHALFADAIRLRLDRGEPAIAFAYAERSRGGSITSAELQHRLAGSGVAVLEIIALPSELVTFAIAANDLAVGRRPRPRATLRPLADASLSENDTTAAAALYDDLIRPVDVLLARVSALIIVPDPRLQSVPFAALYDAATRRYLIERFPVAIASSATSLQRAPRQAIAPSLAAIALPSSGATNAAALPDAARETGEIAALYRRAETIDPAGATLDALQRAATRADVLHIAGHTEAEAGGGEQALLLAGSAGNAIERVSWKTIVSAPRIRAGTVVLAACETLRPPASAATQAMSLGQAFATAGAADVIGTLAPIGDRDARLLFAALHRRIAAGERPAGALRAAQQEAIAQDPEHRGRRAWRAVALLTTRIPI